MPEHSLLPERIFGLAAVDGRHSIRPGQVIRFRFRARNTSEALTPSALLVFGLPGGWTALDPAEAEIPPIAPGAGHVVTFRARPDVADASTSDSPIQAALHIAGAVFGSNVVRVHVYGQPRLNGPASSIRIDPGPDDTLHVAIAVVNEGDAAARNVRVAVPPPPGFAAAEPQTAAACDELAAGASLTFGYDMIAVAPPAAVVRIDDAYVAHDGGRVALISGATCLLEPVILPPAVDARRSATWAGLTMRIANAGWVAARDVRCVLELPAGWRALRGTMLADRAPARIRSDNETEGGVAVTLPLVPARGFVDVSLIASATRPRAGARLRVRCGGHIVEHTIPEAGARSLRIEAHPESAFGEPGTTIAVAVDLDNNGETLERATVSVDGANCWSGEVRPGAAAEFVVRVPIAEAADGRPLPFAVTASGEDGTELARTAFEIRSLHRPWIAVEGVAWDGERAQVTIRNVGATTARDVRVAGESTPLLVALAPGETRTVALAAAPARHASIAAHDGREVPIDWDDRDAPVIVHATLSVANTVRSRERLDVRLCCAGDGAVGTLRIRPQPRCGAAYVTGSTTVNGHAVVDGIGGPPLFDVEGLVLHGIPAGTAVEVGWSLLPRTPGELVVAVDVDANGRRLDVPHAPVRVVELPPFGARPAELPFHVDAATVGDVTPVGAPVAPDDAAAAAFAGGPELTLTLDGARSAAIARVLRGSRAPGIAGHLPVFAVLFASGATTGDEGLRQSLAAAGEAVRAVYERLFVKLRIPGYDPSPHDLEDASMRRELLNLLDALAKVPDGAPTTGARADLSAPLDRERIGAARGALASGALGSAHTPAAIAQLLPRTGTSAAAIALGAYVTLLAGELEGIRDSSDDAHLSSAAARCTPALDAARAIALAALDPRAAVAAR